MERILVCDDQKEIVNAVKIYLEQAGYTLYTAFNGQEALSLVEQCPVDLILMDIMMPGMDGLTVTAKLRAERNIPIILLTAKSEEQDLVQGLEIGADDYITKPFRPAELLARVKSILRRYKQLGGEKDAADGTMQLGDLVLDDSQKTVTLLGDPVNLTPLEYKLLYFLMQHPGQVFSGKELYEQVWGEASLSGDNAVSVHIRHLREKLEIDPNHPRLIQVVWGQGYKLAEPSQKRGI